MTLLADEKNLKTDDFDYHLPHELIAQEPAVNRSASRMMVVDRTDGSIEHRRFTDFPDYFDERNVIVLNNTEVLPARLFGIKEKGTARLEVLLTKQIKDNIWEVMMQPARRVKIGDRIIFNERLEGVVTGRNQRGRRYIQFEPLGSSLMEIVEETGIVPLPPYIKRSGESSNPLDRERYQTIFARKTGSIAAPTAGLHFDYDILNKLKKKEVILSEITLTIGPGTFAPVNEEFINNFKMEREQYEITRSAARDTERALIDNRPITAIGTTVVRALESNVIRDSIRNRFLPVKKAATDLFITPGYKFKIVSRLLTNFHLPRSSLLMLVSSFAGRDLIMEAYNEAIKEKYRFYSYGDCMLIL